MHNTNTNVIANATTNISTTTKNKQTLSAVLNDADSNVYHALKNSVYPGAKDESIGMVLEYCKAKKYDPLAKAVHIVPMNVKNSQSNSYEWRDIIMPGIASYRIDADRTGLYLGITEPEYGPTITEKVGDAEISYPEWCKVTVEKYNATCGRSSFFSATEFWKENYATKGKGDATPNAMWIKRARAQLAKCAEAQALRKAFPDVLGNMLTFEEMEGKEYFNVIDKKETLKTVDDNCPINPEQLENLELKIKEAETPDRPSSKKREGIISSLNINSLSEMRAGDYENIIARLNREIAKKKQSNSLEINNLLLGT